MINSKNCNYCGGNIDAHFLGQLPSKILLDKFKNFEFWNKCQYYRELFQYQTKVCSDIYCGSTYKSIGMPIALEKGGFTFYFNTDGANKFKSSSWSV